jgi:predicted nucleic acid-binding protein
VKICLDTSVIIAAIVENHKFHETARTIIDSAKTIIIPCTALNELAYVTWKLKIPFRIVAEILMDPRVDMSCRPADHSKAVSEIAGTELSPLRFNDTVILNCAKREHAALATLDAQLKRTAERAGLKTLP